MKGRLNVTLKEIAKLLDVSPSTVSLVRNNKEGVSDETRERVSSALLENGYLPLSPASKSDMSIEQKTIRFLKYSKHYHVVDGNEGFVASIIDSAEREARKRGFNFLMTSFDDDTIAEVFLMAKEQPYQGVILLGTEFDESNYHYLDDFPAPLIVVDNHMKFYPVDSISMDNQDIVYMALQHLHNLGHPQIGYLCSRMQIANCAERFHVYERAIRKLGLPFMKEHVYPVSSKMQGAYEDIIGLLQNHVVFPSALFADNDSIAMGAIRALKEFHYEIPEEISIIGFDNIPFCEISEPQLTTMRVSTSEIGRWTIRRLCQRIAHPSIPVMKMQVGAEIICRKSTLAFQKPV